MLTGKEVDFKRLVQDHGLYAMIGGATTAADQGRLGLQAAYGKPGARNARREYQAPRAAYTSGREV